MLREPAYITNAGTLRESAYYYKRLTRFAGQPFIIILMAETNS